MEAGDFEYRQRYLLHTIVYALGLTAPWNVWLHFDPKGTSSHAWGLLALDLAGIGSHGIGFAFNVLLALGIGFALAGAALRTWGSAYLGAEVVQSGSMHTAKARETTGIIEAGPYRFLRNPLYLGTMLHSIALALLMPRSGAILTLVAIPLIQIRLILAEERFLRSRLGADYVTYCAVVPRLLPAPRARIAAQPLRPRWLQAILGEIYMWGVALSFATLGWRYSAMLLIQGVVVSFGMSLLVRAISSRHEETPDANASTS